MDVLKRICGLLLALFVLMSALPTFAADDGADVVATYQATMRTTQGVDNWYFCTFLNGEPTLFEYYPNVNGGQWGPNNNPRIKVDVMSAGRTEDVGLLFEVPKTGMVKLTGKCFFPPQGNGALGDGVDASIVKNNKVLWSQHVVYGTDAGAYDLSVHVREGEKLKFIVNKHINDAYDSVQWWPSVSYISGDYAGDSKYQYFEKTADTLTPLQYDVENDRYPASDGVAFISEYDVMPSEERSLVKSYTVTEEGRYRVNGSIESKDKRGGGNVVTVKKNDRIVWSQLFPSGENGNFDVRMLSDVGDRIDVEVSTNEFVGYNYAEFSCEVDRFVGSIPVNQTTGSTGDTCGVLEEYSLSSLITSAQGGGANYYLKYYGEKYPMTYNTSNGRWTGEKDSGAYLTKTNVMPGSSADVVIDMAAPMDGTMRITGALPLSASSDGVLTKVLRNGQVIWSSRTGDERSVRWDDPYDVSYFVSDMNATVAVKAGDIISFTFGRWRLNTNDLLDISKINIAYIVGNPLTKTTKWKIAKSLMIDTQKGILYKENRAENIDVFLENGTTYVSEDSARAMLGSECTVSEAGTVKDGKTYIPIRKVAEANGKSVVWAAGRIVVIHDEIPGFFGYSEMSELDAAVKGGVWID